MSSQSINWQTTFTVEVVDCEKAQQDSYAKDIDCKWNQETEMQIFEIFSKSVSTNFDPEIYTDENKFQLYQSVDKFKAGGSLITTINTISVQNTEIEFRNSFFWPSKYKSLTTAEWIGFNYLYSRKYSGLFCEIHVYTWSGSKVTKVKWFRTYFGDFAADFAAFSLSIISVFVFVLSFSQEHE